MGNRKDERRRYFYPLILLILHISFNFCKNNKQYNEYNAKSLRFTTLDDGLKKTSHYIMGND